MLGPLLLKANTLQLFTKEVGLARALDKIPSVRITEGVNQTGLLLLGEGHSRREYMFHPSKNLLVCFHKDLHNSQFQISSSPSCAVKSGIAIPILTVRSIMRTVRIRAPDRDPAAPRPVTL